MRKIASYLTVCAMILVSSCSGRQKGGQENVIPVKTVSVNRITSAATFDYVGVVEETVGTMLSFEVTGNVQAVYADAGKRVKKGELLAVMNQESLKNVHEAALATLKQVQDAYARYEKLHVQGSMPEIKWVEVDTKLQQAVSAEAIARKNLESSKLYAPFSGVIASRMVEPGMNVVAGEPTFKLVDIQKVNIRFSVPENEISQIEIGRRASFSVSALGEKNYEAKISEKGVLANPLSHTYDVKMEYVNRESNLVPGMVCKVKVYAQGGKDGIIVPSEAVFVDESGKHFVWLVEKEKATRRWVRTGKLVTGGIEITDGLSEGDKIIVWGSQKVSEGTKVSEK